MAKLSWDTPGERFYEAGVDQGVLYVDNAGYAWNGLISVQENSPGGEPQPYYVDGFKYVQLAGSTEFEATLEALSSPPEFGPCDGTVELHGGLFVTDQKRYPFGLSYRTHVGNDLTGTEFGYKIHVVYNALAAPSDRENRTITDGTEPLTMSWSITTNPPVATGFRPTAHFIADTSKASPSDITQLEALLYGSDSTTAILPTVTDLLAIFA